MNLCSILVIDDEPYSLVWLKHFFHQPSMGFEVVSSASSAIEAMTVIRENPPDLIISDIRMPEMNGIEFLQYLKRENAASRVILVSAFADFSYAQEALHLGALDYLLKPVNSDHVRRVLDKAYALLRPSAAEDSIPEAAETDDPYAMMIEYINKNYTSQIRLQDLAEHVHLNASYCSNLFQKNSGISFSKYLIALRISKAQELLKCKSLSISRVASMVGYADIFYFSNAFKQVSGLPPSEYRKTICNKKD